MLMISIFAYVTNSFFVLVAMPPKGIATHPN